MPRKLPVAVQEHVRHRANYLCEYCHTNELWQHNWVDHFIWSSDGLRIVPRTAIGRVTASLLQLNRERILYIRAADVTVDRHPPFDDPIQSSEEA